MKKDYNTQTNLTIDILRGTLYFVIAFLLLLVMHFLCSLLFNLPCFYVKHFSFADDKFASSLIGTTFTLFGFSLTMRNILISRYSSNYNGFSMKILIEKSTNLFCKCIWYLILVIPFFSLFIYFLGYRRRMYALVFLSGACVAIYFLSVLWRIRKTNCRRTIEYIFIDNLFDTTDSNKKEYRKEFFKRLISFEKNMPEAQLSFSELLNQLSLIFSEEDKCICCKRYFFKRTIIQNAIRKKWICLNVEDKELIAKEFSEYSYNYFSGIINESSEFDHTNLIVQFNEISRVFLSCNKININEYRKYLFENPNDKTNNKYNYVYLYYVLYFNLLFGLFCACLSQMNAQNYSKLVNQISLTALDNNILLSDSKINMISLVAIYYMKENNLISRNIATKSLYELINKEFNNISHFDYLFFINCIYQYFTVFDYSNYLKDINLKLIDEDNSFIKYSLI